jgi:hypothetical protein
MGTALSTAHSLNIRRLRAEYLVARHHPEPERLRARLDELLARGLAEALPAALASHFASSDASVWLIRRLQVAVDVNANMIGAPLMRTWARQIEGALAGTLAAGGDGEHVLWFPNRAAFLACFLADLADGSAWGKWQYEQFDGLRLLPTSAALRTVIAENALDGLAALQQLPPADLRQVLQGLTRADARRVLDRLAEDRSAGEHMRNWRAAWSAWQELGDGVASAGEPQQALHLYVIATQLDALAGGPALRTAALTLTRLAHRLSQSTPAQAETLLAALASADLAGLYVAAGPADAEAFGPLLECPPAWVRQVGEALLARRVPATAQPEPRFERQDTTFGGLFLLLPLLDELPLAEATAGWPEHEQAPATALVRLLLLSKCCGQARASRFFYDPLARDLLGLAAGLTLAELAAWQHQISAQNRRTLLETLGRWHSARGAIGGELYVLARAPGPGTTTLAVLLDGSRGIWLDAWPHRPRNQGRLARALHTWIQPGEYAAPLLLCDPRLLDGLGVEALPCPALGLLDEQVPTLAEGNSSLSELLARLDKLPADLAYLTLPQSFGLQPSLDRALSIVAYGLLRALAWRLPGFAFSSLPYVYANFLDFTASLEDQPDRRVVRLGRPPLHLVLNMTGMARGAYRLSWLDERPLTLFQQQE